jgi:hypothetical protein
LSRVDSVVSDEMAASFRAIAFRKRAPEAAAQLDRVRTLHAVVQRAMTANLGLAPKPDARIEGLAPPRADPKASAMRLPK